MGRSPVDIPKFAVITRTKDRGILLERAIKSVHQQTMKDFVHVIINDAGDPAVVDALVEKYHDIIHGRVRVIHNTQSAGMEAATNKAVKSVDSVFIAIHDDDDSWHPTCLQEAMAHLETHSAMGVVVTADKVIERMVGTTVHTVSVERWLPGTKTIGLYEMCSDNYATPITFLYRRSVFERIGYYDESLQVCGDWDFGIRFLRTFEVDFLPTEYALAYYHLRPESSGQTGNSVYDGREAYYINRIANKYLREDLATGGLGVGYIFNTMQDRKKATLREMEETESLTEEYRSHNARVEKSLLRIEKLVVEATSPKRVVYGTARFTKRLPKRLASKALRTIRKAHDA